MENSNLQIKDFEENVNFKSKNFNNFSYENRDILHDAKMYFRLLRRLIKSYIRNKLSKRFTNVIYVTTECSEYTINTSSYESPIYYMEEMRKQYPNTEIILLLPIIGLDYDTKSTRKIFIEFNGLHKVVERTSVHFDFFARNEDQDCVVYKFLNTDSNIKIYGLFSPAFSYIKTPEELNNFENLVIYLRAARFAIRKINKEIMPIDIVHADKIPFFAGSDFEPKFSTKIKVLQTIDDFAFQDREKKEPFWAAINLADKKTMKKICKDGFIKACISDLFNIHPANFSGRMKDYLDIIYKNYTSFRMYANANGKNKGEIIFNNLNKRILKILPQIFEKGETYYYPLSSSIKKADYYAVYSKTYFNEIINNSNMPELFVKLISGIQEKFSYVMPAFDFSNYKTAEGRQIYNNYSSVNFRENRKENKNLLIKEFSKDRINTNFIDKTLFLEEEYSVLGYLDNFYESPLLFVHLKPDIFGNGIDIIFGTLLKMFELNKNFKIILSMPNGLKFDYIKSRLKFLKEMKAFDGRWVFLNDNINITKFFAGADMFLMPLRENYINPEHLLGMKFGCVPVVSESGYLNDTVTDIFDNLAECNGFKTKSSLWNGDCIEQFYNTLNKAIDIYRDNPSSWNVIIRNCMNTDSGYNFSMLENYNNIYEEIL